MYFTSSSHAALIHSPNQVGRRPWCCVTHAKTLLKKELPFPSERKGLALHNLLKQSIIWKKLHSYCCFKKERTITRVNLQRNSLRISWYLFQGLTTDLYRHTHFLQSHSTLALFLHQGVPLGKWKAISVVGIVTPLWTWFPFFSLTYPSALDQFFSFQSSE